jgi:hypothetical protein
MQPASLTFDWLRSRINGHTQRALGVGLGSGYETRRNCRALR